jgi:hypothetical protein
MHGSMSINFTPTILKSQTLIHKGTLCLIAVSSCHVDDTCNLMGYYAAQIDNSVATFWDNLSSQNSRILNMRTISCPETSVRNYHSTLRNIAEELKTLLHRNYTISKTNNNCVHNPGIHIRNINDLQCKGQSNSR